MSGENIMRLFNDCMTGGRVRPLLKIITKTSAYTITPDDFGSVFTTRGAAATMTFTLPTASTNLTGEWVLFVNVADYHLLVQGDNEGLVVFNNLTADNIGFKTTSELIGGALLAICDGTSWIVLPLATETQTLSIDTTATSTSTSTTTATHTATSTSTGTLTKTATDTPTKTATDTATATGTAGSSVTLTVTKTATDTRTKTATDTTSASATKTFTETDTTTSTSTTTATGTA